MKPFRIIAILVMAILLSSCASRAKPQALPAHMNSPKPATSVATAAAATESAEPSPTVEAYSFPQSVQLPFQPVELTELAKTKVSDTWQLTNSIAFGQIAGEPVKLAIYKGTNPDADCGMDYDRVGLLEYDQGGESLLDSEELVFVLSASLVIDSMS
ncbi:hypothetical protein [Pseudalkalibacillus salsuginis]|uniref:hypothetical protein n=1 Tax=Pseudalkalibacillus salsuginis TaxID=2910972 RepID=UPI001F1F6C68|nr:hypothetical protein [Pseudalkalibacillus salsuginis]MCF6409561.1 hypothetical protein [Pseudalkalibacillus salsuginis]